MNFNDYINQIKELPSTESLVYFQFKSYWPTVVKGINDSSEIIKIPPRVDINGNNVEVSGFSVNAFKGNTNITDLIFTRLDPVFMGPFLFSGNFTGALAGCSNLRRITIPSSITKIGEGTFMGCDKLEDIYYEGSIEDWKKIKITHEIYEVDFGKQLPGMPVCEKIGERLINIPGNDVLFTANIHFNCNLKELYASDKQITCTK